MRLDLTIRKQVLEVEIINLQARKNATDNFCMNVSMGVEGSLLESQIKALKDELFKVDTKIDNTSKIRRLNV